MAITHIFAVTIVDAGDCDRLLSFGNIEHRNAIA